MSATRDTAGYETTDSAIVGGTTTIVDFAPQDPDRGLLDSIDYRINVRAKDKSCVDFALHSIHLLLWTVSLMRSKNFLGEAFPASRFLWPTTALRFM